MRRDRVAAVVRATALTGALAALLAPAALEAHDIPVDVAVQAFVKPEGRHLRVLIRAPLDAMRDVDYPRRGADGLVDVARADAALGEAARVWLAESLRIYEGDERLPPPSIEDVRISLQGDRSFTNYDKALALVTGPRLPDDTTLYWTEGMLDVLFDYPIQSDRSRFSIDPAFGRLGLHVVTALRFLPPGGAVRAFEYQGNPGLVRLDPRWYQASLRFVQLGFFHILDGTDHLLFLFCLVIPFRRLRALVPVVTAFTVAHSLTLIASAYGMAPDALWFPPLIETLIAMSIVYMALENIVGANVERRWLITFGFGLVHGFGFSFALRQTLQFAGAHLLTSLLSFNVGVELGQILVLLALIPALELVFRFVVAERMGTIILSALVAHTGWHWMVDRYGVLRQFDFQWPVVDATFVVGVLRALMLVVAAGGLLWLVFGVWRRPAAPPAEAAIRADE